MVLQAEWRGPLVSRMVHLASQEAVEHAAEETLDDANGHVPFDTGELKDSGGVDTEQARGDGGMWGGGWDASVFYDTRYAVPLHEHPEFNFQGSGEGKWLENAVQRAESRWPTQLAPPLVKTLALP